LNGPNGKASGVLKVSKAFKEKSSSVNGTVEADYETVERIAAAFLGNVHEKREVTTGSWLVRYGIG
jgi:hypothetical protein